MSENRDDTEYATLAEVQNHRPGCKARGGFAFYPHRCTCDAPPPRTPEEIEAKIAELEARILSPALTRDEAARRLTPGALRVMLKHVNDTANDAFYTATVGLDLPDDDVPLFVANATASLLHDEIMAQLYGPPVETPTPEGEK